jgi:hypothetical protein
MSSLMTFALHHRSTPSCKKIFSYYSLVQSNDRLVLQLALKHPLPTMALGESNLNQLHAHTVMALGEFVDALKEAGLCENQDAFPVIIDNISGELLGHYSKNEKPSSHKPQKTSLLLGSIQPDTMHVAIELNPNATKLELQQLTELLEVKIGIQKRQHGFPVFQPNPLNQSAVTYTPSTTITV